jgi:hypothetical protein
MNTTTNGARIGGPSDTWLLMNQTIKNINFLVKEDERYRRILLSECLRDIGIQVEDISIFLEIFGLFQSYGESFYLWALRAEDSLNDLSENNEMEGLDERIP